MSYFYVSMLGEFSISCNDKKICEKSFRSKKIWALLQYLITFRKKEITSLELIEVLWKEDKSENPTNALKTLLHRARGVLANLDYEHSDTLIKSTNGSYFWNTEIDMTVDVDIFEQYYNSIRKGTLSQEEKLNLALNAIDLYKGSFLSNASSDYWVMPLSTYYNTIFIETVHIAVDILYEQNRFFDIVDICKNALSINPYEEDFYYNLINSLFETGDSQSSIEHYKNVETFFYSNFGVNLSEKFLLLYKKICNTKNNLEFDMIIIEQSLFEKEKLRGGFLCEYEFFKNQFQLKVRAVERNDSPLQICLISICDLSGKLPSQQILNVVMQDISEAIRISLRGSDLFSRFSVSQFVVMLSDTSFKNAEIVLNRINSNFSNFNTSSEVSIKFDIKTFCEEIDI